MALVGAFLLYKGFSTKKPATTPVALIEQTIPTVMTAVTPTPLPRLRSMNALEGDSSQAIQPIEGIPQGVKVTGGEVSSPTEVKQPKPSLPRRIASFLWKILTSWPAIFIYVLLIFWRGGALRCLRKLRAGIAGRRRDAGDAGGFIV